MDSIFIGDIIEINPPMAAFAYLPGRCAGPPARRRFETSSSMRQLLLLAHGFALCRVADRAAVAGMGQANWGAVCDLGRGRRNHLADARVRPARTYGDADLPARARSLLRCAAIAFRFPLWAILIACWARITLAFKPFFAVPVGLCMLAGAVRGPFVARVACTGKHHRGRAGPPPSVLAPTSSIPNTSR